MKYYSTNKKAPAVALREAVIKGLAPDGGLYMPEKIKHLVDDFFENMEKMSFYEIALTVANAFFGEDVNSESLEKIVEDTLSSQIPAVKVEDNI